MPVQRPLNIEHRRHAIQRKLITGSSARGKLLSRDGVNYILRQAVIRAAERCESLRHRKVSPHTLRHTTAMHLLQAGVDISVIALWLGHESIETTHIYLEANQTQGLRCKVIDHRTVVEVHCYPAQFRSRAMKVEDDIQSSNQIGKGKRTKQLKWRRRIDSPRAFYTEKFTWDPLIDQHRTRRRLDDIKQLRKAVVVDTSAK